MTSTLPAAAELDHPQLFLDDLWIADCARVERVWHPLRRYPEPVLRAEQPWEHNCPVAYGTVLQREGAFHMWYCGWTRQPRPHVCYASSDDGIHWRKPPLKLHEVCGTWSNNIVIAPAAPGGLIDDISVIEDDQDDRYPLKAIYFDSSTVDGASKRGLYAAKSKDGLHWEAIGLVLPGWYDRFNAIAKREQGRFVVLGRAPGTMQTRERGRRVWRVESDDLEHWSDPTLVLEPDADDPVKREFYSATAFRYGSTMLGTIERMAMTPDKVDCELIWSHDGGWNWRRSRLRPSLIPWGAAGSWDDTWINLPTNGPLRVGRELWFYYSGRSAAHGAVYPHNHGAIGLATLRADGFCSLRAEALFGQVTTPTFTWPEQRELLVNFDARRDLSSHPGDYDTGELRVEVQDEAGGAIEHFSRDACEPTGHNTRGDHATVRWSGGRSLRELGGWRLRLRFWWRDGHLYSFRAGASDA